MAKTKIDLSKHGKGLVAHRYITGSAPSGMRFICKQGDFSWHLSRERELTEEDAHNYNRQVLRPLGRMLDKISRLGS